MLLLDILLSFMKIVCLCFGGAYAAIPVVEREVVSIRGWMTVDEFSNLLVLDELTPGPIILNSATFVGMKVAGIPGAIAATVACVLPPCIIILILLMIYRKYRQLDWMESAMGALKCMALALIGTAFIKIAANALFPNGLQDLSILSFVLTGISFILLRTEKVTPLVVMLGCGLITLIVHFLPL